MTAKEDVALVTFPRIASDAAKIAAILNDFAAAQINIDMISHTIPAGSHIDLSFSLPGENLAAALELIGRLRLLRPELKPMVSSGNCKIQLYGEEMRTMSGVAAHAMASLAESGAELLLITTSEVDISLLVPHVKASEAVQAMELAFEIIGEWQ